MARPKTCKNQSCKAKFTPMRPLQQVCGMECAIAYSKQAKAKQDRAETKAKKLKLKTRSQWMKEAQVEYNRYIRLRDRNLPCISCGVYLGQDKIGGVADCGHYRSVGSAPHLRFDERNAHAQCKKCNRYGSGRVTDYRIGLIGRIGILELEKLEADQEPKHYTIDDLKAIKEKYRKLANELEKQS